MNDQITTVEEDERFEGQLQTYSKDALTTLLVSLIKPKKRDTILTMLDNLDGLIHGIKKAGPDHHREPAKVQNRDNKTQS